MIHKEEEMDLTYLQVLRQGLDGLLADYLMHLGLYGFTMFLGALYVTYVLTGKAQICELILVLVLFVTLGVVAQGQFNIHWTSSYVQYVEDNLPEDKLTTGNDSQKIQTYEKYKTAHKRTWVVGITGLASLLVLVFLLAKADQALWRNKQRMFVLALNVLIGLSLILIWKAPQLARP